MLRGSQRERAKAAAWKSRIWAIGYRQNNNAPSSDQRPMGAGWEEQTQLLAGFPGGLNSTNTGVLWDALAD